jgi:hypothetical protein
VFAIITIVIVVVPVALGAPTMTIFIPPAMIAAPAIFARFAQVMARSLGLFAIAAMMLDGFVKTMIRFGNALLAIVVGGAQTWSAAEQESRKRRTGQRDPSSFENSRQFCLHSVLLCFLK